MRKLVINADGYGFTPGVNEGIIRTFEAGLVRSTSCTPNFGFLEGVSAVAKRFPAVSFGIHFNISVGKPVLPPEQVPSLVDGQGKFHSVGLLQKLLTGKIRHTDIVRELTAQAAILADEGVRISHWDGHQNKHLYPGYFDAGIEVAQKFGIKGVRTHRRCLYSNDGPISPGTALAYYARHPARIFTHIGGRLRARQASRKFPLMADKLITPGYVDTSHKSASRFWFSLADTLPAGSSEVYCHPAIPDDLLRANAKYVDQRAAEVECLIDPALKARFDEANIRIVNFYEI